MVEIYIDFDDVIMDTSSVLFSKWDKIPFSRLFSEDLKIKYIKLAKWEELIKKSDIIKNSISELKDMDPKMTSILTKVHSMENESVAKVRFLRDMGVKQKIIIVPYHLKKTDMVDACGNILVDDCVRNLDHWKECGGTPIFFSKNDSDIDNWGDVNTSYTKVKSLNILKKL